MSSPKERISRYDRAREEPSQWTLRLDQPQERNRCGGKALGLYRLLEAGFEVPRGFTITTAAFRHVVEAQAREVETLEELREKIRTTILPPALVEEIRAQLEFIGAQKWAVRSSGVDEDSKERSFAGQGHTVLNLEGLDDLLQGLREVWAAHFKMESLLYRARDEVQIILPSLAVVVQEMLAPTVGGVLFTVNPLTGDDQEVIVSSARGSGESVVRGETGETHYLDKASGYIRRHITEDRQELLSEEQLRELTRIARGTEQVFGSPQDVEWAYAFHSTHPHKGKCYLLQSRPITTDPNQVTAETVWTNTNVGEALPGVATPMTWSIIHDFSQRGFEQAFGSLGLTVPEESNLVRSFRGRIYLNLTQFMSIASGIPLLNPERLFSMAGGGGVSLVKDVYEQRSKRDFLRRLPLTIPKVIANQVAMPLVANLWGKYFTGKVEEFFDRDLEDLGMPALKEELTHLDGLFDRTGLVMLSTSSNFLMSYVVAVELLRLLGGPEASRREQELFSGLNVKSAEPGFALLELGRIVRRSLRLRKIITQSPPEETLEALWAQGEHRDVADFLAALDRFRKDYGHRAPREAELATPRWREDTTFLFEVMRSFVEAPHLPSSMEVERDRKRTRKRAQKFLDENLPGGVDLLVKGVLAITRSNARRREYMRDRVVDALDVYRRFFLAAGRRMTAENWILRPEEVFFLTRQEIEAWLDGHLHPSSFGLHILTRKALYDHFRHQPDPPDTFLLRGDKILPDERPPLQFERRGEDDSSTYLEIAGLPGSPGRVTGRARVILDPSNEGAHIQPGEILVAPYTDVGWTPLFLTAAGVVMSLGGPLSHSCIVAREYGIPTVVNAKGATEILHTGDWVTVDGDRGVIYVRRTVEDLENRDP